MNETPKGKTLRILSDKREQYLKAAGEYALQYIQTDDEENKAFARSYQSRADGIKEAYDVVAANI